jgi:hypothetical protein
MVHALREIWRVLIGGHSLIDLRPQAGQSRVEVIAGGQVLLAGLVDESDDRQDDLAADAAIAQVVEDGWFSQVHKAFFDYATYWDTANEMKAYAEARWTKSHLPETVLAKTRKFMAGSDMAATVRIRRRVMIARYQKIAHTQEDSLPTFNA